MNGENMPLYSPNRHGVSILLPTFNRVELLPRALKSVLAQSFPNWELLVIDDGSDDNTLDLITDFTNNDKRIHYFRKAHSGLPLTMNKGIELSKGKYISFLGSDDEYRPDHLKLRFDLMEEHRDVDFLHGGVVIIGEQYVKDRNNKSKLIHLKNCIIGGTFFGKREVFIELKGFRELEYSEDFDFYERARKGFNCRKVEFETYIYHRNTPGSICNSI